MDERSIRPGEIVGGAPDRADATLVFIGRIRTPFRSLESCPRHGRADGPLCRIEIDAPWRRAMQGLAAHAELQILYWMDRFSIGWTARGAISWCRRRGPASV